MTSLEPRLSSTDSPMSTCGFAQSCAGRDPSTRGGKNESPSLLVVAMGALLAGRIDDPSTLEFLEDKHLERL